MSTVAVTSPLSRHDVDKRPPLARLIGVELRKTIDTRAGFWTLLSILAVTIAALVTAYFAGGTDDHTFKNMFVLAAAPAAVLLPIVGILLVSSEWTQRTTLITFALVPRRERVVAAKVSAGVILAGVAVLIAAGLGALGTLIAQPGIDGTWSLSLQLLGQLVLYVVAAMLMGVAFGAALQSSSGAIVAYFLTPIGLTAIGAITWFEGIVPWLSWWRSVSVLADKPLGGAEWAHAGTAMAVWLALPMVIGLWRIARQEIA